MKFSIRENPVSPKKKFVSYESGCVNIQEDSLM